MKNLLFLFICIVIFFLFFFLSRTIVQKELTSTQPIKLKCNSSITNCDNNSVHMPKGVCAPGQKCT